MEEKRREGERKKRDKKEKKRGKKREKRRKKKRKKVAPPQLYLKFLIVQHSQRGRRCSLG